MRRRHRRKNNQRKIIILSIIGLLFIMVVGYSAFQTNLNINVKGNIVERSRVIQSWEQTSDEDFHTDYYRENIVSATFLDSNAVPSDAVESWDVSADKDKGVMAYVVYNNDDNTKYDLYIGANKGVIANENSSYLFYNFTSLTSIDFSNNYDTSNVTSMAGMFQCCISIEEINLSNFDTHNVTSMNSMFSTFNNQDGKPVSTSLLSITFGSKWDTSGVWTMNSMFYGLNKIKNLDLSFFNTQNVTDMYHMFLGCSKLESLNLCSWNTSKVISMYQMFTNTSSIQNIFVGDGWTTALAETYNGQSSKGTTEMFDGSGVSEVTTGQC